MAEPGCKADPSSFTVIGARDFICAALVDDLRRHGARVSAVDRVTEWPGTALCHVAFVASVTADFQCRRIASPIEGAQTDQMFLKNATETAREFIYIDDVVQISPRLIAASQRIYNLASGTNTAYASVVECLSELSGAEVTWKTNGPATVVRAIDVRQISEDFSFTAPPVEASVSRVWMQLQGIS